MPNGKGAWPQEGAHPPCLSLTPCKMSMKLTVEAKAHLSYL